MNTAINTVLQDVLTLKTYAPSRKVSGVMGDLVEMVVGDSTFDISRMPNKDIENVRAICATTETELEKKYARDIVASSQPRRVLKKFPYANNYAELAQRELRLVRQTQNTHRVHEKALVVGSGPLPFTALELHRQADMTVDHLDSSNEAINLCRHVCVALGVDGKHFHGLGQSYALVDMYNLVVIAALAGATADDKQAIIDNILPHLAPQGRIVVRSARGNRGLLYPAIESTALRGVKILNEYHPTDHVINSVFVYGRIDEA